MEDILDWDTTELTDEEKAELTYEKCAAEGGRLDE